MSFPQENFIHWKKCSLRTLLEFENCNILNINWGLCSLAGACDRFFLSNLILIVLNCIKLYNYTITSSQCLSQPVVLHLIITPTITYWRVDPLHLINGSLKISIRFLCSNISSGISWFPSPRWLMILKAGLVAVFQQKPQVANSSCRRVGCLFSSSSGSSGSSQYKLIFAPHVTTSSLIIRD